MRQLLANPRAVLLVLFTLLYGASPLDAVPDAVPLLGVVDDLGVAGTALVLLAIGWRRRREEPALEA